MVCKSISSNCSSNNTYTPKYYSGTELSRKVELDPLYSLHDRCNLNAKWFCNFTRINCTRAWQSSDDKSGSQQTSPRFNWRRAWKMRGGFRCESTFCTYRGYMALQHPQECDPVGLIKSSSLSCGLSRAGFWLCRCLFLIASHAKWWWWWISVCVLLLSV